jgi:SAM-dependent methyltransferase
VPTGIKILKQLSLGRKSRPPHPTETPYNSLAKQQLERALVSAADRYASGKLLDIGCGEKPYKAHFAGRVTEHVGVDQPESPHALDHVDVLATATSIPLPDSSFDTALLSELLEHLEEPLDAIREAHRLLRPGGHVIITTPFIWVLHEEPRDFFRYSPYGLRWLLEQAGFDVIEVTPIGGQWSTLALLLSYSLRESRVHSRVAAGLSTLLQSLARRAERRGLRAWMAYNHLAVARKPD